MLPTPSAGIMSMTFRTSLVALLVSIPFAGSAAQDPPFRPGQRLRVQTVTHAETLVGRVIAWQPTRLLLAVEEPRRMWADTVDLPLSAVARLEVHRGWRRKVVVGALAGLLGGSISGGVLLRNFCLGTRGDDWIDCADDASRAALVGGVAGGLLGAGIGALVGSLIRSEQWENVSLHTSAVRVASQRDGRFGLGLSVRFRVK